MSVLNIELSQIESTDIPALRSILTSDFRRFIDINKEMTIKETEEYFQSLNSEDSYSFTIKASKDGEYKKMVIGVCGITNIDWINSNGNIMFVMLDKSGYSATIQNHQTSKNAFEQILKFGFHTLNLRKLSIEIFNGNDVMSVLEEFGFVAEGVRRSSKYKGGQYIDTTVCSIVTQEFKR
jgi:RimJ/RimL family protein N-acetyltransferase